MLQSQIIHFLGSFIKFLNSNSRNPSAEGRPDSQTIVEEDTGVPEERTSVVYSFMVEECILAGYAARAVVCPLHGSLLLSQITPDIVCITSYYFRCRNLGFFFFQKIYSGVHFTLCDSA